jgi:large subunit ribosomal protein L29
MRIHEVRDLSDDSILKEIENTQKEMLNLRFRHATKQLTNTSQLGLTRKKLARLKTVARERQLRKVQ